MLNIDSKTRTEKQSAVQTSSKHEFCPAFFGAFLLFLSINLLVYQLYTKSNEWSCKQTRPATFYERICDELGSHSTCLFYRSRIKCNADAFNQLEAPPQVVLLGSSLIMYPFWKLDQSREPKTPDIGYYPFAKCLDEKLEEKSSNRCTVFNWGTMAQMLSDSYVCVDKFLDGSKKPHVVVLAIAPRDFYDHGLASVSSSPTFEEVIDPLYLVSHHSLFRLTFENFVQLASDKVFYLHSDRASLQKWCQERIKHELTVAGFKKSAKPQIRENSFVKKYRDISMEGLGEQQRFLNLLIAKLRERNIRLIVVNMPLPQQNLALLPIGLYREFRNTLKQTVADAQCSFIDLSQGQFEESDFIDEVHLGAAGGIKLIRYLAPAIRHELTSTIGR